jgi:hypothetical protein
MTKFKYLVIRKTYEGAKVLAATEAYRDAAEVARELEKLGYQMLGIMDLKTGSVEMLGNKYHLTPDELEWWKRNWQSQIARGAFWATKRGMKRGWK